MKRRYLTAFVSLLVILGLGFGLNAHALDVGDAAPEFELSGSDGAVHRLSDYAGQHVVIAFFPKAFTGG